jgi:DNA polymerase-1
VQLGSATGRNSCRCPNLVGLPGILRPAVRAPEGRALLDFDYSQIEVCVLAHQAGDSQLAKACSDGRIYDRIMEIVGRAGHKRVSREGAKRATLALINGGGEGTLAWILGLHPGNATACMETIESAFPAMAWTIPRDLPPNSVEVAPGLVRRFPAGLTVEGQWRSVRNSPIQGLAAVIFKEAVVAVDSELHGTSAGIVLPMHDGLLVECDERDAAWVKEKVIAAMVDALEARCPSIRARVQVNDQDPTCWNKNGDVETFAACLAKGAEVAP